jgi:thiamine biosynthesis lipoprotein
VAAALAMLTACAREPAPGTAPPLVHFDGRVMGTTWNVRLVAEPPGDAARAAVAAALTEIDDLMTTYRESEVTRFNAYRETAPFAVDPATAEVARLALRLAEETGGAFDVTVAPLVSAFGFGPETPGPLPTAERLAELRRRTGWRHLSVDAEGRLVKAIPELEIDLSAVAKGYAVDRAGQALEALGHDDYMVEVGGEVRARGANERGEPWRIGIERPEADERTVQRVIPLPDLALATSGDYRNYREVDGVRVSHLVDPRTASPIGHHVASATVVHADCATADGLATAMMVLGEEGLALAAREGWAVMLLVRDGDGFREATSPAFDSLLESSSQRAR